jgi:hypothetical protein
VAVVSRPGADRGGVVPQRRRGGPSKPCVTGGARRGGADPTACVDVALGGRAEFARVLGVEVDLVGLSVEAECDGLLLDLGERFLAEDVGNGRLWLV